MERRTAGKSYLRSYKRKRTRERNSSSDDDESVYYSIKPVTGGSGKKTKLKQSERNKTITRAKCKNRSVSPPPTRNSNSRNGNENKNGNTLKTTKKLRGNGGNTNEKLPEESTKTLLTYPPNSGRLAVVSLIASDIKTLNPNQFLNDQVIDFWLQFMYKENLSERDRARTHVFSSYFFNSLRMGNSARRSHHQESMLRNWTKNINIFKKDFIFIPISHRSHWFVAVICFPYLNLEGESWNSKLSASDSESDTNLPESTSVGENSKVKVKSAENVNKSESTIIKEDKKPTKDKDEGKIKDEEIDKHILKKPCILIFDSMAKYMKDKERTMVYRTLWQFLTAENNRRSNHRSVLNFTAANTPACVPVVPQQTNKTDCGLFVFKYFENFFSDPIESYEFPIAPNKTWFDRKAVAAEARENVYRHILRLTALYSPDNLSQVPTLVYCQKMMSDEEAEPEGEDEEDEGEETERVDDDNDNDIDEDEDEEEDNGNGHGNANKDPEDEDNEQVESDLES